MTRAEANRGARVRQWARTGPEPSREKVDASAAPTPSIVSIASLGALATWLALVGCYRHDVVSPRAPLVDSRPALPAPFRGRYLIRRQGRPLGEENLVVSTTSTGTWRVEGTTRIVLPVERVQGFSLDVDVATREPTRFSAYLDLLGERHWVRGRREGELFEFEGETIAGRRRRSVPYALGTVLDFPSPSSYALPLSLLGPSLEVKHPVRVRAISVLVPSLEPAVMVETYELHGVVGDLKKITVLAEGDAKPTALWVRPDGFPVRIRTWVDEGPPIELTLDTSTSTAADFVDR